MKETHIDIRVSWCLWNAVAVMIPVVLSIFIGGLKLGLSGVLSYSYALIAVAYFLFDQHLRVTNEKIRYPNIRKYGSLTAMFGILVFFAIYNLQSSEVGVSGMVFLLILTLVIAFLLAYSLNLPLLNRQVLEEERREEALQDMAREQQEMRSRTRKDAKSIVEDILNEDN